jgi:hypothetical protein
VRIDMSGAMIVVMAVMMVAMMGGALWGLGAAVRSRSRRHPQHEQSTKKMLDQRYTSSETPTAEHHESRRDLEQAGGDEPSSTGNG